MPRMMDKPLLVVNPRSGGGRTGKLFDAARPAIERVLGEVDVATTERARHAVEIAREAARAGRSTIVAVGGDGSFHEVVNGLMLAKADGATGARAAMIGMGTGGDFRKTLGLEHRLDAYLAAIAGGKARPIDVGRFSYVDHAGASKEAYFVNILSMGVGGLVDRYVAETTKAFGGTIAYTIASLRAVKDSVAARLEVTIEDDAGTRTETRVSRSIAVCNGEFFGSGMHIAPMAKPDDGMFEVVDLGGADRLPFLLSSSDMYTAKHLRKKGVSHFRARKITVRPLDERVAEKVSLDVDGEPLGRVPITIEVVPRAIDVLAP
jgi:YegS/Rv2252/BmrU family lipid kinase